MKRNILCIDLKSFFASCECVERRINPFTYPLVVANKKQGMGAMTLAVTPYLKEKGVKSRGRLYEIPKNIKYEIVNPRMNLYTSKSKEVISIYLDFVSKEDLYVYSIDECFLDVTNYLKMYKKSDYELALEILKTVYQKTGLTATCGIGPNMLLAKVAMDIEAKHTKNNIAKWTYNDVKEKLWPITPLSKMWGIGKQMENNLNKMGIYKIEDLAKYNVLELKDKFGVIGVELWNHANGIDSSLLEDYKRQTKVESYSHSQVLFKDYNENNIKLIIREMVDVIAKKLRDNHKLTRSIGLGIGYSKEIGTSFYHLIKLDNSTDLAKEILKYCLIIFDKFYEYLPIRKVTIVCGNLENNTKRQLSLFADEKLKKENTIDKTIDIIKEKYGQNSLIKATSLLDDNKDKKIGGHDK